MNLRNKKFKWLFILLGLYTLNTITYYTLGPSLLRQKMLSGSLGFVPRHHSDTLIVANFKPLDCALGESTPPWKYNLKEQEAFLKKQLDVKEILFITDNGDRKKLEGYGMQYTIYPSSVGLGYPFNFFRVKQTEHLILDNTQGYEKSSHYFWFFFCWVNTFEYFSSWDIPKS